MFSIRRNLPMDEWISRESLTTWSSDCPSVTRDLTQWMEFWTKQFTLNTFRNESPVETVPCGRISETQCIKNVEHQKKLSSKAVRCRQSLRSNPSDDTLRSPITGVCILPREENPGVQQQAHNYPSKVESQRKFIRPCKSVKVVEKLARIRNRIGDYVCRLCSTWFPDAFSLAEHLCPRMTNLVYPCDLCPKVFQCPANLASHRRWHKVRPLQQSLSSDSSSAVNEPLPQQVPPNSDDFYHTYNPNHTSNEVSLQTTDHNLAVTSVHNVVPPSSSSSACLSNHTIERTRINATFRASKRFLPSMMSSQKTKPTPYSVEALLA